ncbi:MAG: NAD-dependent epimerase/dehydratase family protein [bacterium]
MKILVAGGAGYIGSRLVPAIIEKRHQVDVVDLLWFGNHLPEKVKIIKKDAFDCQEKDLSGYDQVIFLAGISSDLMAEYSPVKNFIMNGALPVYLAFIARKAGVKRFIYASSCSVYGYAPDHLYTEDDPAKGDYPYGISKLQGEKGLRQLNNSDFSIITLRLGTVSGHSPRMRLDLIVNAMFKSAITTGKIKVINQEIWRPICDIRDVVAAFSLAIEASEGVSGLFNICSDNFTVGQAAEIISGSIEKLSGHKIVLDQQKIADLRNFRVSIEKAKRELKFKPRYLINDIVDDLYSHKEYYGDFEKEEFYNAGLFK